MRPRVVLFAVLCAASAALLFWLALGGEDEGAPVEAKRRPAVVARQVDRAPEIGAEKPSAEPAPEAAAAIPLDDAPVVEVLDILEALARGPEGE
jgi:hypothetical protein